MCKQPPCIAEAFTTTCSLTIYDEFIINTLSQNTKLS